MVQCKYLQSMTTNTIQQTSERRLDFRDAILRDILPYESDNHSLHHAISYPDAAAPSAPRCSWRRFFKKNSPAL